MSITDELRKYATNDSLHYCSDYLAIADRIDAEHEAMLVDARKTVYQGYIELPKDADGEYIHAGDVVVAQLLSGGESKPLVVDRMELSRGRDGDLWCVALDTDEGCWNQPSMLRHHSPTVEDVLEEFAQMYIACNDKGTIAEYAKRLRLVGEDE